MGGPPAENANASIVTRRAQLKLTVRNTGTPRAIDQLRDEDEADFRDLVAESDSETQSFEIACEIAEMRADESNRASHSCLRETALAKWWQSRKAVQS